MNKGLKIWTSPGCGRVVLPVSLLAGVLVGCAGASTPFVQETRLSPARLNDGEAVTVFLTDVNVTDKYLTEQNERTFEDCMWSGMKRTAPKGKLIRASKLRQATFPEIPFKDFPRRWESLATSNVEQFQSAAKALGVHYFILLDVKTTTFDPKVEDVGFGRSKFTPGVGTFSAMKRHRSSTLFAVVYDVPAAIQIGNVSATSEGKTGMSGVGVDFWPLPILIPTMIELSWTETKACKELGVTIGKMLTNDSAD